MEAIHAATKESIVAEPNPPPAHFYPRSIDMMRPYRRKTMVRKYLGAALLVGTLLVSACNTIEGAGRDVKSVGNTVEKAAK